jgi:uncharacterized membrane protein
MESRPEPTRPGRSRAPLIIAGALAWAALVALARRVPPDGREHGNLPQFVGRLHPVLVHAPVALLLLVPLLELAALRPRWAHLRLAAGWILAAAALAAFAAAYDGWLLAWGEGLRGRDVTLHMWAGVALAGAGALAVLAHSERARGRARAAYPALLVALVGLVLWTGHLGGVITRGNGYVTEKMPARLRRMLRFPMVAAPQAESPAPAPASAHGGPKSADPANAAFYRIHVAPLLSRSCVTCHRPEKHKGGLRMDSFEQLMRGGDDGPVVVPGKPSSSELIRRVELPPSDDDSMPSDGDKPLATEEIQLIERWIAAGAKGG